MVFLHCDFRKEKGKVSEARTYNWKKVSVVRASYAKVAASAIWRSPQGDAAYRWLVANNPTYAHYVGLQEERCRAELQKPEEERRYGIRTSDLLLHSPGLEVAAFPLLYPLAEYGDTDVKARCLERGLLRPGQTPNPATGFLKKAQSLCLSYMDNNLLVALMYDVQLANGILGAVTVGAQRGIQAESIMANRGVSAGYWKTEQDILADVVRQKFAHLREVKTAGSDGREVSPLDAMPNVFITVAPGEWLFPSHWGVLGRYLGDRIPRSAGLLVLHLYHVILTVLHEYLVESEVFWFHEDSLFRIEYQGRGTLHVLSLIHI